MRLASLFHLDDFEKKQSLAAVWILGHPACGCQTLTGTPIPTDYAAWRPRFDPGLSVWDMWWTKWHWAEVFSAYLNFLLLNIIPPVLHMLHSLRYWWYHYIKHKKEHNSRATAPTIAKFRTEEIAKCTLQCHNCWAPYVKLQDYFKGIKWDSK